MSYYFCDFKFEVITSLFRHQPEYDVYRLNDDKASDCAIEIFATPKLDIPEQKPIFQNIQGLRVVQDGNVEYRYYSDFFTGEIRELLIDNGTHKLLQVLDVPDKSLMTELDLINCLAFEKTLSEHGRFVLHSSFIETSKGAVLFTAPSGTGKSTQADLWHQYRGCEIINGDRSGIWKAGNTWMAGGVPWCGTSGIMKNKMMPLRAIVILKQGIKNEIQELRFASKVGRLLEQITVNPWNKDMLVRTQIFCMTLCQEIPVLQFTCKPDFTAVEVLEQKLEEMV